MTDDAKKKRLEELKKIEEEHKQKRQKYNDPIKKSQLDQKKNKKR